MMSFVNYMVVDQGGLSRISNPADGIPGNFSPSTQSADSAQTLTAAAIQGGLYIRSGMTAGRTDTTDTAANIIAANPQMDIGDNFLLAISNSVAFALTIAGGVGVTMGAKTTIAASSFGFLVFTKTSATAMTCTVL